MTENKRGNRNILIQGFQFLFFNCEGLGRYLLYWLNAIIIFLFDLCAVKKNEKLNFYSWINYRRNVSFPFLVTISLYIFVLFNINISQENPINYQLTNTYSFYVQEQPNLETHADEVISLLKLVISLKLNSLYLSITIFSLFECRRTLLIYMMTSN